MRSSRGRLEAAWAALKKDLGNAMNRDSTAYRWHVLAILTCSQVIAYIDRVNLSVAGPELVKSGLLSAAWLGVLFSAFNWAFTFALLAAGPITDRFRPSKSLPLGVLLWSAATASCGLTTAFAPLTFLRGLVGVGEASMIPAGSRILRETFPLEHRAVAIGTFFAGNKIGLSLGIPLSSFLLAAFGWRAVFTVTGGFGALWLMWWFFVYKAPPIDRDVEARKQTIHWSTLLQYRTTWGTMLGQAGYLYIYYVFVTWLPGYLVLQRHMSVLTTGFVGMLPFIVGVFCTIFGGWLGDRLIAAGRPVTIVRKSFAVGGLLAATIFTIAAAFTEETVLAVTLLTLAVAGFSFCTAHVNSMPLDVAPKHIVSSLVSLQNFGGNVGGSFAPILTGLLISSTGDFKVPLLVTAGVALVFGCGGYGLLVGKLDSEMKDPEFAS
jgi:MFS transporter, ACS family, D-galactonate transporter